MSNPWNDESVARQQLALAESQLAQPVSEWPVHFKALVEAVKSTQCPGSLIEVGCASAYNLDALEKGGVELRRYNGIDISMPAVHLAGERHPENEIFVSTADKLPDNAHDVVLDGSTLLHVDNWLGHLKALCWAARRWVILHRAPLSNVTHSTETHGYGKTFPAWNFAVGDIDGAMLMNGFERTARFPADGHSETLVYARPRHWVTYADGAYLPRLKALHASLKRHAGPFRLHVLAWDGTVFEWALKELGEAYVTHIDDFLEGHIDMRVDCLPGPPRTRVEHMWSCGPRFICDVMEETGEPAVYIDADCYLFSSPEPMFAEIGGAPAGFVGHNFARAADNLPGPKLETHGIFGLYNVGVLAFSDRRIVETWARLTYNWCRDRVEAIVSDFGDVPIQDRRLRYGDQKYLEDIVREFRGVHVVQNRAAFAGPWNVHTQPISVKDGAIYFGEKPLGIFHFSGLKELPEGHSVNTRPEYQLTEQQAEALYAPYWAALREAKQ